MRPFGKSNTQTSELRKFLRSTFGMRASNIVLFHQAVRHKSVTTISHGPESDNERLEYLGDAILGSVVADFLFKTFPDKSEGTLSKMRAAIVSRANLNRIGKLLNIESVLDVSNQAMEHQKYLYGNALEALIGAIYLDKNYNKTYRIIQRNILDKYIDFDKILIAETDPKSTLYQWAQRNGHMLEFHTSEETGPSGLRQYDAKALINGDVIGNGTGTSKKEAEQKASLVVIHQKEIK